MPNAVKCTNKYTLNITYQTFFRVLKGAEGFDRVYVKRDVHPAIRKEHSRLYKLVKDEKQKPENQGCDVVYDMKNGVVKRGDVVIATYAPHF